MLLNNLFGRNKRNAMKPAPTHLWNPPFCGDMDLLIRKDGVWVHEGKPIKRRELVKLFASILCVDSDGDYYLVSPQEKVRIRVEKYPFVIQEMDIVGEGRYQSIYFTTNVGEKFQVTSENSLVMSSNESLQEPSIHVRDGLMAGICRTVYYRFADSVVVESSQMGFWSSGEFFSIGDQ